MKYYKITCGTSPDAFLYLKECFDNNEPSPHLTTSMTLIHRTEQKPLAKNGRQVQIITAKEYDAAYWHAMGKIMEEFQHREFHSYDGVDRMG
jgi:hypothetical protein